MIDVTTPDRRRHRIRGLYWRVRYLLIGYGGWTLADEFDYREAVEGRWTP